MFGDFEDKEISAHHVHFVNDKGVTIEVHYKPASGLVNPIAERRLLEWLNEELLTAMLTPEGFYSPSIKYALVMQLMHIMRHFSAVGIGLRQITDYYWLLCHSTEEDRKVVGGLLKRFGLYHIAEALMWVLQAVLHLEEDLMLCPPDAYRGEWFLREIIACGNFGDKADWNQYGYWRQTIIRRLRSFKLLRFDFWALSWQMFYFCLQYISSIPNRIKRRIMPKK